MNGGDYWSWWVGGLALGFAGLAHPILTSHLMAVSGIVSRSLSWRQDERDRLAEDELADGALDDALLAATLEEFGEAVETGSLPVADASEVPASSRLPISAGVTFLVAMTVGGFLSAWSLGGFSFQWSLGESFDREIPRGWLRFALPIVGGMLVGFGAAMAGGCTSSHGLAGCARFQPGSLVATAAFFVGGIVASQLVGLL